VLLQSVCKCRIFFEDNNIQVGDYICYKCRTKLNKRNSVLSNIADENREDSILEYSSSEEERISNHRSVTSSGKKIELYQAHSGHKHCLLCKKKAGLHRINPESLIFAYKNYGIIMKDDTRCCSRHLEKNGCIKESEFLKIPKRLEYFHQSLVKVLDVSITNAVKIQNQLINSSGVFDKFKDLGALEENLCIKITGWTKIEFCDFSKLVTSVKDTAGRTKEQLIAIYRYWLSKGLDQETLSLLKYNTSQQQISHYLSVIR
jgi:hypothetical protein